MIPKHQFMRFVLSIAAGVLITIDSSSIYAQEKDPGAILKQMSEAIAKLDKFIVTGEAYVDVGLDAGQIIEQSMDVTMRVNKPNAMRITNRDAESTKELYFVDGILTIYTKKRNFHAKTSFDDAGTYGAESDNQFHGCG